MSNSLKITIPVGYRDWSKGDVNYRMYALPAEIRVVPIEDAPVAISMAATFPFTPPSRHEWRVWEGKLWSETHLAWRLDEIEEKDLIPQKDWKDTLSRKWLNVYQHPLLPRLSRSVFRHVEELGVDEFEPDAPEYRLMAERAMAIASRSIMMDGVLYEPSFGPALKPTEESIRRVGDLQLEYCHAEDASWARSANASRIYPATEAEAVEEICGRHFSTVETFEYPPVVHIADGYTTNLADASLESAAMALLRSTRLVPLAHLSRDVIEATVGLRHALQSRYPHRTLPFGAATFDEYYEHLHEEVAPPAEHLLEPVGSFLQAAQDHFDPLDLAVGNTAVDMFNQFAPRMTDDSELLSSMTP